MKVEVKEKFPIEIASEGTVMDFVDNEFVFIFKDQEWSDFEIQALKKNKLVFHFLSKFDIAVFLLTVLDAIDTSDFIFNLHDNEYPKTLFTTPCYDCSVYLIDAQNIVQAQKHFTLSKEASSNITKTLNRIQEAPYYEAEFDCNLEGLQQAWEPFELEEFSIVQEQF